MNTRQARVIDPILTTHSLGYRNGQHIGMELFPRVGVGQRGGQIIKFGKEAFILHNARRAPGAGTKRITFNYGTETYGLVQDALEAAVPREVMQDASQVPGIDLAARAVNVTLSSLSLALENEQATLATTAANYDADHKVALAGTDKWSDPDSDPVAQVKEYREAVRATIGIYPNKLVLSAQAFNAASNHPKIVARFQYKANESVNVTAEMLATLFGVKKVVVGEAIAVSEQGATFDVWGNNAILAYVPEDGQTIEVPSYGYTYTLDGNPSVETPYWDLNSKSWVYGVTYERQPLITGMAGGFLIQNPA
jgi:hypothetical protein